MISRIIFVIVGSGLLIWAYTMYGKQVTFLEHSKKTSATVVENFVDPHEGGVFPVVAFKTSDGRTVTFKANVGSSAPKYQIDQQVDVLYDPAVPENAQIDTSQDKWLAIEIVGTVGAIFLALGVVAVYTELKNTPVRQR